MTYKRKEVIGNATLYLGNAKEIIPTLEKVDCVITDPPYLLTSGGATEGGVCERFGNKDYKNDGKIVQCDITWQEIQTLCYQVLKEGTHAYVMSNNRNLAKCLTEFEKSGFGLHNILVWDKCTVTPNRFYMNGIEFCVFGYKGKAKYINDMSVSNLFKAPNIKGNGHPTEKPVALMKAWVIQSTNQGDTVIDPFMGIATTGIATIESGRKFIGIEIEEKYFDISCKRIEQANNQYELFY